MAVAAWDSRLARLVALPLRDTWVHPNHVTTLGLVVGLGAAACYATGSAAAANLGAALYVGSVLLDHVDGELARLSGKCSAIGQAYDRAADLTVRLALFAGMGLGLRHGELGNLAVGLGLAAGIAFVVIFVLRGAMAKRRGWDELAQPSFAGFELEDILYVIAPVTWLGWLGPFVVAAGIGAPLFSLWVVRNYRRSRAVGAVAPILGAAPVARGMVSE
jgi:phosphatidylglycerophosphate synthase